MNSDSFGDDSRGIRVGVDIGGTFTDIIAFDPETDETRIRKVPSTPSRPADGVIDGLEQLVNLTRVDPEDITALSHGSTVAINALIEHSGARTGLLVTDGFAAIPLARHGEKPDTDVKNPRYQQPAPLVPQDLVYGVPERVDASGAIRRPLDESAVRDAVTELQSEGVDSIAVCLLFSFLNPNHEVRIRELINEIYPECAVSLSSEIAPRIREYPRLATTTVSAYVDPIVGTYLSSLERQMADRRIEPDVLSMMLSHGGLTTFDSASDRPASTVLSGPAAGVQGALFTARLTGDENIVTMDMGGTSCDIAIAPDREPLTTTEKEIEQNPISIPMVDIQSIGAGGGTIARVESGRLQVGPDSAGADPGPVCYDRGGEQVTITDANAVLGRLSSDTKLAGGIVPDVEAATETIRAQIAEPLDLSTTEAAAGILQVVNSQMKKELSLSLTKTGCDPREFALLVFGGAGPMHAPAIARELSIHRVVVPPLPGINSAVGLLTTDRRRIYERSQVDRLEKAPLAEVFASLEQRALEEITSTGVREGQIDFIRELELRYSGQSYELTIELSDDQTPAAIRDAFNTQHEETFGHVSDQPIETMTFRIIAVVETEKLSERSLVSGTDGGSEPSTVAKRSVYFEGGYRETPVLLRSNLDRGSTFEGPAIIEQVDTTVVVEPETNAKVDDYGNIILTEVGG